MTPALDSRINRALGLIKAETLRAEIKYGKGNHERSAVQWAKVVQKQLGDLLEAIEAEDAVAVAKELSQISAAGVLALAHLVEDL